jgi:hypothetical protein
MGKYFLILLILLFNFAYSQPACKEDSIMTIIGKWSRYPDANLVRSKNLPQVISRIDKIAGMIRSANPQPPGVEPKWYRGMINVPLVENGPQNYYCSSLYKYWYCNKNVNKLEVAGETGTWGEVFVNSLETFLPRLQTIKLEVENSQVILLPKLEGEWKGFPMCVYDDDAYGERIVILSHNQTFPWKHITQAQYLTALKEFWKEAMRKSAEGYEHAIAEMKKSIKEWKENKDIRDADKSSVIAGLEKGLADYQQNQATQIATSNEYYDRKIKFLDFYISNHAADLQSPAIIDINRSPVDDFNGSFDEEINGGCQLVILDPAYFKKQLPDYVPQLIVLRWKWNKNEPGIHFKNEFEQKFPFHQLVEMLDK